VTGASIETFFADRTLETFGRGGAGWFWHVRRRSFAPVRKSPRGLQGVQKQNTAIEYAERAETLAELLAKPGIEIENRKRCLGSHGEVA
jgi:hypothetical protein